MSGSIQCGVGFAAAAVAWCAGTVPDGTAGGRAERQALRDALAFAATFDAGLDADFARGDGRLHRGPQWGPPRRGEPGLVESGAVTRERRGALRGSALRFHRRTDELLFFFGEQNAPWKERDWSGTVSFWLRAEPAGELADGFCDPVTITSKDWNDAGLFCEFEKRATFRHFRMGAYADLAVWNPTSKPWEQLAYEEKSLAGVEADDHFGGRYTHVAMVFERFNSGRSDGVARLFLDGRAAAELSPRTQTWSWKAADQRIILGLNYVGWLDELALFDRALSAGEIAALHALPGGVGDLVRPAVPVGAARVDVTPDFPVRLCGYASRETEANSAAQRLFARAFAVGEGDGLAVLVSADNCAVPAWITEEVARRLAAKHRLAPERFTLSSTHTHTAPWLEGSIVCMFGRPVPADHLERVAKYTAWFVDRVEEAAAAAIAARAPARLAFAEGKANFARNRRTAGGPVDHALPVLAAFGEDGALRALVQNYACHCTTCGGGVNQHCGDWAGYASEEVEARHPGAVALTVIGCGADANPLAGATDPIQTSMDHGRAVAAEVERLLAGPMQPLLVRGGAPACDRERLELPWDRLPTRAELVERSQRGDAVGYHARWWLAKLDRGEPMPSTLPYVVQSWIWDEDLAQLFLPGEVVVDYALRLKRELDRARLWVSAYSNDVPCYIPSRRILAEGGYEAEGAMLYYGGPTRLAPAVEDLIVGAVKRLVPESFASGEQHERFPPPKTPAESQQCFQLSRDDLAVELVACEPAVQSPVAIDFGPDGTIWICGMDDYPTGLHGRFEPGGRVTWLRDRDGDGRFDSSGVFLEGLPFPTGVMAWRKGVLVCATPDIRYAEDTDGDGRADVDRVLFTGFSTENYQARVNSLTWGLDGWVYGASGIFGGVITPKRAAGDGEPVDCRGRDFRIDPDRVVIEPVEGASQQGRVRDDFGRWFGCDSGYLAFQFPLPDRYVRRNPFVAAPDPRHNLIRDRDPGRVFQISRPLERFNDPGDVSRVTSGCGVGIYRDVLLGEDLHGNAFSCESVANVVRRIVLEPEGAVVAGRRAPEEQQREFLASADPWFRPVQATTGPDGALWIVDMYRFVIEHPRWIPAAKLAELDVRAGADRGRIWRVVPRAARTRPIEDLTGLPIARRRAALLSPNGVVRDLAHRELLHCSPEQEAAVEPLEATIQRLVAAEAREQRLPAPATAAVAVQRAWVDDQQGRLGESGLLALLDPAWNAEARAQAMVLAERRFARQPGLAGFVAAAASVPAPVSTEPQDRADPRLVFQAALSLGEWDSPRAGDLLGEILVRHLEDRWIRAAVLSASSRHPDRVLAALLAERRDTADWSAAVAALVATAAGDGSGATRARMVEVLAPRDGTEGAESWRWRALGELEQAARRGGAGDGERPELRAPAPRIAIALAAALRAVEEAAASLAAGRELDPARVLDALALLPARGAGEGEAAAGSHLDAIERLLDARAPAEVQQAAVRALTRTADPGVPQRLLPALSQGTPFLRALVLGALTQRPEWIGALLAAAESGRVPGVAFDAAHRDRLLRHDDAAVRSRAERLFARSATERRAQVVERFQPALELPGDLARGRETFAKLCANCHQFRGLGHEVAASLAALADRSPAALLTAILDPNAAVDAEFVAYHVTLRDGEELNGLVRAETGTGFTIVQANDLRRTLLRSDVARVRPSKLSLMPEGLEEGLAPQDLADLIAWLRSAPAPLGAIPAETQAAARAVLRKESFNGCDRVVSAWDLFLQPTWFGPCTMHYCRQTDGGSKVAWRTAPVPADLGGAPVFSFRFPAAIGFLSQPDGDFTLALDGRPLLTFDVAVDDARWISKDGRSTLDFECRASHSEDAAGIMTLTVPAELLRAGAPAGLEVTGSAAGSLRWFGVLIPGE